MSNLARSAMSARIAKLPQLPPLPPTVAPYDDDDDDEDEEEEETDGLGDLPPSSATKSTGGAAARTPASRLIPSAARRHKDVDLAAFTPISAANSFAQALSVAVPRAGLDFRIYYSPTSATEGTVVVCHHGAGYSALSFAAFAKEVSDLGGGELGVLAVDARSHGKTKPIASPDAGSESAATVDLSIDTLTTDLVSLLQVVFPDPATAPSLLLLGHSMGGTVVVRACPRLQQELGYRVSGVVVLDVVEGSALDAMPLMHGLLASRPSGFDSLEEAVHWHVSNKTIRNVQSARISVPSLFIEQQQLSGNESGVGNDAEGTAAKKYVWRAPLHLTAPFWSGWFTGLSQSFLAVRTARLLVLAGTDRLDKTLMIGQMQGKFQLEVFPDVGHMLHEDDPRRLAELVVEFWRRNERVVVGPVKIKKVGEV